MTKKKEKETKRKIAEAIALVVTSQGLSDYRKAEADYLERINK